MLFFYKIFVSFKDNALKKLPDISRLAKRFQTKKANLQVCMGFMLGSFSTGIHLRQHIAEKLQIR